MDLVHVSEDRWTVVLTFKENNKDANVAVWSVKGVFVATWWDFRDIFLKKSDKINFLWLGVDSQLRLDSQQQIGF